MRPAHHSGRAAHARGIEALLSAHPTLRALLGTVATVAALVVGVVISAPPAAAATPLLVPGSILSTFQSNVLQPDGTTAPWPSYLGSGVAIEGAGNVFSLSGQSVYRSAPDGSSRTLWAQAPTPAPQTGPGGVPIAVLANGSLAVDAAGNVYWSDDGNKVVWKVDAVTHQQTAILTGLANPAGVAVDAAGTVYVADYPNSVVWAVPGFGTGTPYVAMSNTGGGQGVAVDAAGNLYVSEMSNGAIERLGRDGSRALIAKGLGWPQGLALGPKHTLVLATTLSNNSTSTNSLLSIPLSGGAPTTLATSGAFYYMVASYLPSSSFVNQTPGQTGTYGRPYGYQFTATSAGPVGSFGLWSGSLPPGLTLDPTTGILSGVPTQIGSFQFVLRVGDSSTPALTAPLTLTVQRPTLAVTVSGSQTYGGTNRAFTVVSATDGQGNVLASPGTVTSCVSSVPATAGAGTSTNTITGCQWSGATNYDVTYADAGFTITKAPLTATVTGTDAVGQADPTFSVTGYTGYVNGDSAGTVTIGGSLTGCQESTTAAGVWNGGAISGCGGLTAANYTVGYTYGALTISPMDLYVTASSPSTVYGQTPAPISYTISPARPAADATRPFVTPPTCTSPATSTSPVGTYTTSCSGAFDPNYRFHYVTGTQAVTSAQLSIPVTGTATYGSSVSYVLGPPSAWTGLVNGDTAAAVTGSLAGCTTTASPAAGSYPGSITGCTGLSGGSNYSLAFTGDVTIATAPLTVPVVGSSTYGNPSVAFALAPQNAWAGLVNGDTAAVVSGPPTGCTSTVGATTPAGTALGLIAVGSCTVPQPSNYAVTLVDGGATVARAPLTVPVSGTSTYGSATPSFTTGTPNGLLNGDPASVVTGTPSCPTSVTSATPAGTLTGVIDTTTTCGLSAANYQVAVTDGGFTVARAPLQATVNATEVYGGTPGYTVSYGAFSNNDTPAVVQGSLSGCVVPSGAPVGTTNSAVTGCAGLTAANYTVAYQPGALTVLAAALTITPPSVPSTFGSAPVIPGPSYAGWVNGGGPGALTSAPTCTTTATATSPAGTYPITCSGATAVNYTVGYGQPGTLTVNPAAVTAGYTGPATVSTGSSFVPAATLTGPAACAGGQTVTFSLDANPKTGAVGSFPLGTAVTNGTGVATAPSVSTTGWTAGARTVTVTTTGNGSCLAATGSTPLAVTTPGAALLGAGSYASPAGTTTFAVGAVRLGGPSGGYVGGISVVAAGRWWFSGSVSTYVKTSASQGVVTGTGTLWAWSAAANKGRGGWVVAQAGTKITMALNAATKTTAPAVGVQLGYTAPSGSPALPNSAVTPLRSGAIVLL